MPDDVIPDDVITEDEREDPPADQEDPPADQAPDRAAPDPGAETPLSRNRDFGLLWLGQFTSVLGSRMSQVAYPLLVLAMTGSPVVAGLVATARAVPQWVLGLPSGYLADRWDRRRLMLTCDLVGFLSLGSIVTARFAGVLTYPQIIVVAVVEGSASVLFSPAEVGALRHIVPTGQLRSATARNEAREYGAMLGGPPLGGSLFAVAQALPFLGDALSYLVSFTAISMIRTKFRTVPVTGAGPGSLYKGVRDGLGWLARQRFLRAGVLMVAGSNLVGNGMTTLLIVVGHERGSSAAVVGTVLTLSGLGGLLGSFIAAGVADKVPVSWVVVGFPWVWVALIPLLLVPGSVLLMGVVFGLMLAAAPLWNAVLSTYRIVLVPDELQGRVDSACRFVTQSVSPLSPLLAGVLLEYCGSTTTLLAMLGWMVALAVVGTLLPVLRNPPSICGETSATPA